MEEQKTQENKSNTVTISDFNATNEAVYIQFGTSEPILVGYKPIGKEFALVLKDGEMNFTGKHPGEVFKIFVGKNEV